MKILVYLDAAGESPYQDWFDGLDAQAAAKVAIAITRIELDNLSNVKGVGSTMVRGTGSTSARTAIAW